MTPSVLWFRRDLRLDDNPALLAAASDHHGAEREVLGVFVADEKLLQASGLPRRQFLAGCLERLSDTMGGRLLVARGRPHEVIPLLARRVGAQTVHISADYGPYGVARDRKVEASLRDQDAELVATGSAYAVAPGRIRKADGTPYAVFTPFHRAWSAHGWRKPAAPGTSVNWMRPDGLADSLAAAEVAGAPTRVPELPEPGERAARSGWRRFLDENVREYDDERNRPDHRGTSHMSAYLKWGCIHPRTLLSDLSEIHSAGAQSYRRELAFREFYADLLFHHPDSATRSLNPAIDRREYDTGDLAEQRLEAWKAGRTGYPYIDAGMRQLLAEGWIHNRARMGVASFLVKDLHLPWQVGAAHFLNHLVDGDIASNTYGWQWVAGAGAQAAPFYRVFNPVGQGEKHDPNGDYVRRYVPELAGVPGRAVHRPWQLPDGPPAGYPAPIVDHITERAEALRRFAAHSAVFAE
jgi:deoxyribodipyrimidine photo-lyase